MNTIPLAEQDKLTRKYEACLEHGAIPLDNYIESVIDQGMIYDYCDGQNIDYFDVIQDDKKLQEIYYKIYAQYIDNYAIDNYINY